MGVVYVIWCIPNGKPYVGQTKQSLTKRMSQHFKLSGDNCKKLNNAISKHGVHNFCYNVIRECRNQDELDVFETYYQLSLNSVEAGYNIRVGGLNGYEHSVETRNKIKTKRALQIISDETRKKIGKFFKGRKQSARQIAKRAAKRRGTIMSDSQKMKISISKSGKQIGISEQEHIRRHVAMAGEKNIMYGIRMPGASNPHAKTYEFLNTVTGELAIVTGGLAVFCSKNGLCKKIIFETLSGKRKSDVYKGWKVKKLVSK